MTTAAPKEKKQVITCATAQEHLFAFVPNMIHQ